jgi:hypothetical protein
MRLKRTKRRQIMFLVRKGEGPKAQVLVHWALLGPRMGLVLGEAGRLDGLRKSSGPQTAGATEACARCADGGWSSTSRLRLGYGLLFSSRTSKLKQPRVIEKNSRPWLRTKDVRELLSSR